MTENVLWVHPFNGAAGDMFLGALLDIGADLETVREALSRLDIDGWSIASRRVRRHGLAATNLVVETGEGQVHRKLGDILAVIESGGLPPRVSARAKAVFHTLAAVEAAVHDQDIDDVHFHEVGGVDAIVDIVGSCVALEQLEVDRIVVGAVAVGHGTVTSQHGMIPNPAPATVRLLEGFDVTGLDTTVELTTPTGAALLSALGTPGAIPAMVVTASGFGAGDTEADDFPNLLQVVLGRRSNRRTESLLVIETNVDDVTGEILAHTISKLIATGARDAWVTPIVMKKGRPAHIVSALVSPEVTHAVGGVLLEETGSLGYRSHSVDRSGIERGGASVTIEGHEIRLKVSSARVKAEHDDVIAVAEKLERPAREIAVEAESIWRSGHDRRPSLEP